MAAAYRSHAGTTYGSRTNTTISAPAGIQDGDELLLYFILGSSSGIPTPTWPSGFTVVGGPTTVTDGFGFSVRSWTLRKRASGESGSYTVTHSAASSDGVIVAVSGCEDNASPNVTANNGTGTGSITFTGLTTSRNDAWIGAFCHNWVLWGGGDPPSGTSPTFTERQDSGGSLIHFSEGTWGSSGATGSKTKDSDNADAGHQWAAMLVGLETPAPPTYEQEGFRFRRDDGSETTATWKANQDTDITETTGTNIRLRILTDIDNESDTYRARWEFREDSDAAYRALEVLDSAVTSTPTIQATNNGEQASDATSHTISLPASIAKGEILVIVFSVDGSPTCSIDTSLYPGWVKLDQQANGVAVVGAVFAKYAEGSDANPVITTTASEQSTHITMRVSGAGWPSMTITNGSSTNSNPPANNTGYSRNYKWVATRSGDSTTQASAAPSSYSNLTTKTATNAAGASTAIADRSNAVASEDPGTFTSSNEQWVTTTIAFPPADLIPHFIGSGVVATGTTSLSVAYPTGIKKGDLLVLAVGNKYPTNGPSTPAGWTLPTNGQGSGGAGSAGVGTGNTYATVFYKESDGTETGSLSVTITSGNCAMGRMFAYGKGPGRKWSLAAANGADNSGGATDWSATAGTDPGITTNDVVLAISAPNASNPTYTSETITSTGVTFAAAVEWQDSSTTNGDDCALVVSEHRATAGTSSGAPVFTMTASTSGTNLPAGATTFFRIRGVDEDIVISGSANITASGENTTAQLTAPSGKTTSDFGGGRLQDDENPTDTVNPGNNQYREDEICLKATSTATNGNVYQFRLTRNGTAYDTYTVTPQWTIGSAGFTVTVNQVSETDTSQTLNRLKVKAVAQNSETDTAQLITGRKYATLGQSAEADLAQTVTWNPKIRQIAQVSEADLAQTVTWNPKIRQIAQVSETDSAQPVTLALIVLLGQVSETDLAQSFSSHKNVTLGQSSETDTSQALTHLKVKAIGQPSETDSTQSLTGLKTFAIGLASESDTAQTFTSHKTVTLGQASESDLSQPVAFSGFIISVSQTSETDSAHSLAHSKVKSVSQASETDLAQSISRLFIRILGQSSELDLAQTVSSARRLLLGQPSELDSVHSLSKLKVKQVSQAVETDSALVVTSLKLEQLGQVSETDVVFTVTPIKVVVLGIAEETDISQPLTWSPKIRIVGLVEETDLAQTITVAITPTATIFEIVIEAVQISGPIAEASGVVCAGMEIGQIGAPIVEAGEVT